MERASVSILFILILLFASIPPAGMQPFDSPIATPAAAPTPALGLIPPPIWIIVGLILGSAIIFIAQRTTPHDR